MKPYYSKVLFVASIFLAFAVTGCRESPPHTFAIMGGKIQQSHPKPMEGGYYSDWDPYAATVEISPVEDVNPVRTQHVFIVTVKDKDGEPLPNRRVEWIIPDGVGSFVEVDESGWRDSRGYKIDNRYAITHTNNGDHTLTRGNDDPSDDIVLKKGQTWAVITSAIEGTTNVIAYVPGIYDWDKHKAFAVKHWLDIACDIPAPAINPVMTSHEFVTKVTRQSNGAPLVGYMVNYEILDGPAAKFNNGSDKITVNTDSNGLARTTLKQVEPVEGVNNVAITVTRPADENKNIDKIVVARGKTSKTWIAPKLNITKTAPATAIYGDEFSYAINYDNPGKADALNVVVTDTLPKGVTYVSASPKPDSVRGQTLTWNAGTLAANAKGAIDVTVKANTTGKVHNTVVATAENGLKAQNDADTVINKPDLKLTKTATPKVMVGQNIDYELVVSNPGSATATNVQIVDDLPDGLKSDTGKEKLSWKIASLPSGKSATINFKAPATQSGKFVNTAFATADHGLKDDAEATTIVTQPILKITKTGPPKRYIGKTITYAVTVTNKGDGVAMNTVLVDTLPAGVIFVSASDGGKHDSGKISWELGDLDPNESKDVSITVRSKTTGDYINVAQADALHAPSVSAQAKTIVEGIPAILLECIDTKDPIEVGSNESYVITVTNQGTAPATNVVVKGMLPDHQTFVSATGPGDHTVKGSTVEFDAVDSLRPKAKVVYRVISKAAKEGDSRFKVELTTDQNKTPIEETESTNIYSTD
jgi:uncharacterized repeat protein (TIGR01451 family)